MEHNHKCHGGCCKHENIKYCKECAIVYCADCGKEWVEGSTWEIYPYPSYYPYPIYPYTTSVTYDPPSINV